MLKVLGRVSFCLLFALASCGDPGRDKAKSTSPAASPTAPKVKIELGKGVQFLKFYAEWCGPCKTQKPIVEKLERAFPSVRFQDIDVDKNMELAQQYKVRSIPCMIILVDGQEKARMVGLHDYEALVAKLTEAGVAQPVGTKDGDTTSPATSGPPPIASKVEAEFTPQPGQKYEIVGPSLYKADDPGPAGMEMGIAWSLANEFVYRTSLARKYALSAAAVSPDGAGFKATFKPLGSGREITVEVDAKAMTIVLVPTSPTVEQPGSTGDTSKTGEPNAEVTEAEASRLATEHVNSRFKGYVWKTDCGDRTFLSLSPGNWPSIEKKGGRLILRCGGVRGQEFEVSMKPDGTDIRVDHHGYAVR